MSFTGSDRNIKDAPYLWFLEIPASGGPEDWSLEDQGSIAAASWLSPDGGLKSGVHLEDFQTRSLQLPFVFQKALMKIERFEFYERAKKAFAVVATG